MDSHLTTLNRSRSSQTPSPSHSASASATSSLHKSKLAAAATEDHAPPSSFPPSSFSADTRDGALTSSDDLESISARGADSDSDADDLEDDFDHDNNSSIRTFTTARLESEGGGAGSVRNMKLKTENSTVKIENTYGGKDEGAPGSGSAGPPGATAAVGSTMAGISTKEDVKIFTENIQTSGAYSAREESLKREEEAGRLKFVRYSNDGVDQHMGFTKEIHLERDRWQGYIKDYDGGILMECKIDPKLPYTDLSTMIRRQRQAIDEKIRELSNCQIVYPGIDFQTKEAGIPKNVVKGEDIPGLKEAGWTPDQWGHTQFRSLIVSVDNTTNQKH